MRPWIGAAILAGLLGALSPAAAQTSAATMSPTIRAGSATPITEFSSRHRGRAHAHRQMRRYPHRHHHWGSHRGYDAPHYYARPYYYRPYGIAPFFPFGFGGYGFQHSW